MLRELNDIEMEEASGGFLNFFGGAVFGAALYLTTAGDDASLGGGFCLRQVWERPHPAEVRLAPP